MIKTKTPIKAKDLIASMQEDLVRSRGEIVPVFSFMSIAGILISDMERLIDWQRPANEQALRLHNYNATDLLNAIRLHNWHFKPGIDAAGVAFENYEHLLSINQMTKQWLEAEGRECSVGSSFRSCTQMPYGQLWPQRVYYERVDEAAGTQRRQVEICATPSNQLLVTFSVTSKKDVDFRHPLLALRLVADRGADAPRFSITRLQGEIVTPEEAYALKPTSFHTVILS